MRSTLLAGLSLLLAAVPAAAQRSAEEFERSLGAKEASQPGPGPAASPVDALGRPLGAEAMAAHGRIVASLKGRKLSAVDDDFLLAVLNLPPLDAGPFQDRERLARHFAEAGVGAGAVGGACLAGSDLWRLVRAARAAAAAFHIPPAVLLCLTFHESGFNRGASAWTTSAKGVAQLTNGAVGETLQNIQWDPELKAQTEAYARELGAEMPAAFTGAPDVDALTRQLDGLRARKAPPAELEAKRLERRKAIASHKDEPGHIYNIETNFGLGAAYLSHLRVRRLKEVPEPRKGWLTAVAGYNQGMGYANALIYDVFKGPARFNAASLDEVFSAESAAKLKLSADRQAEMLGEVGSVRACACP